MRGASHGTFAPRGSEERHPSPLTTAFVITYHLRRGRHINSRLITHFLLKAHLRSRASFGPAGGVERGEEGWAE